MKESRARYISLIIIASETILAFFLYGTVTLGMYTSSLGVQGSKLPGEVIIFLLVFTLIGIFVILGAFFKWAFYVFSLFEIAFVVYIIVSSSFFLTNIIVYMIILAPQITYCILSVFLRKTARPGE